MNWLCGFFEGGSAETTRERLTAMAAEAPPALVGLESAVDGASAVTGRWTAQVDGVMVALSGWPYWADGTPAPEDPAVRAALARPSRSGSRAVSSRTAPCWCSRPKASRCCRRARTSSS